VADGTRRETYAHRERERRTELDQLILEIVNLVLQDAVCVFREERDDMFELYDTC